MTLRAFRKRTDSAAILASIFFFLTSCMTPRSTIENEPWFLSAKNYVEGYELGWHFGLTDEEKALTSWAQIGRAKEDHLNSRQPTAREILAILSSDDDEKTKIALGAMVLRPLTEYEVMKKIISFWDHQSEVHRSLASMTIIGVHRDEIGKFQDLGDMVFEYTKETSDLGVFSHGIRILGKFNNPKYLPFIVEYLKKHDNDLFYYSSFWALKEMDDEYFQRVQRQLQMEGDTETLENFNRTDDFWKKMYGNKKPSIFPNRADISC